MNREERERYSRQILFQRNRRRGPGKTARHRAPSWLVAAHWAPSTANLLVRAGLGRLAIIDRDFVEPSNLQRQTLFEEVGRA